MSGIFSGPDSSTTGTAWWASAHTTTYPTHTYRSPDGSINLAYAAVRAFQAQHSLRQDGIVASGTLRSINAMRAEAGLPRLTLDGLGRTPQERAQAFLREVQSGGIAMRPVPVPRGMPDHQVFNMQDPRLAQLRDVLRSSGRLRQGQTLHDALAGIGFDRSLLNAINPDRNTQSLLQWMDSAGRPSLRQEAYSAMANARDAHARGDIDALARFTAAEALYTATASTGASTVDLGARLQQLTAPSGGHLPPVTPPTGSPFSLTPTAPGHGAGRGVFSGEPLPE